MLDPTLIDPYRLIPTAFTRQRCLTVPRMLATMIAGMCTSVQAALDDLFAQVDGSMVRQRKCSDRAFAKARRGLSWRVFEHLNTTLFAAARERIDAHRWCGLRVVAADGSRLRVSTRRGAELAADHYAFALFVPGAELTLHAELGPADACERQMLFEALDHTAPGDLLVLDRGFPGKTMLAAISQRDRAFCVRVDATGWHCVKAFLRSGEAERVIEIGAPCVRDAVDFELQRRGTAVRLIRDVTPAGSVRVLMTSLLDGERYPAHAFGALYHQRWRVEEAFKRIKHRLGLEAVTGLTHLALRQDIAAKVLADNLYALLSGADHIDNPDTPQASRPNRSFAFGALKPILAGCLLGIGACLDALHVALETIARTRCRLQTGRSYPRPPRRKPHRHSAYKAAL